MADTKTETKKKEVTDWKVKFKMSLTETTDLVVSEMVGITPKTYYVNTLIGKFRSKGFRIQHSQLPHLIKSLEQLRDSN